MTLEPFEPTHLWQMDMQIAQADGWRKFGSTKYTEPFMRGVAHTVRVDGVIMACGGIINAEADIGHLWSFISRDAGPHMIRLHGVAKRMIEMSGKKTLVATSERSFLNGCRWLQMLKFMALDVLPGYGIDGADHVLYGREV